MILDLDKLRAVNGPDNAFVLSNWGVPDFKRSDVQVANPTRLEPLGFLKLKSVVYINIRLLNQVYTAEPSGQSTLYTHLGSPLVNHPLPGACLTVSSMETSIARRPIFGTLYGGVLLRNGDTRVARLEADALTSPVAVSSP